MKLKNIFMLCGTLLIGTMSFTSCGNDEEHYDVDGYAYDRIYFDNVNSIEKGTIVKTPAGIIVSVNGVFNVKTTKAATTTTHVSVAVDNSLIDDYNTKHGTYYQALPDGVIDLNGGQLTIKADTVASDTLKVTVAETEATKLNSTDGYLVPIVITGSDNSALVPSRDLSVRYLHISYVETVINDDAKALLGEACDLTKVADVWNCVSASGCGLESSEFKELFDDGWSPIWEFTEKGESSTFIIDLGDTHKVSAFTVSCQVMRDATVEISTDNSKWITLGNTADHKSLQVKQGWNSINWFVLYGAMPARYVKVKMNMDANHYYWNYISYGYCGINRFNLAYDE